MFVYESAPSSYGEMFYFQLTCANQAKTQEEREIRIAKFITFKVTELKMTNSPLVLVSPKCEFIDAEDTQAHDDTH